MTNSQSNEELDEIFTDYIEHAGWSRLLSSTNQYDEHTLKQAILNWHNSLTATEKQASYQQGYADGVVEYAKTYKAVLEQMRSEERS